MLVENCRDVVVPADHTTTGAVAWVNGIHRAFIQGYSLYKCKLHLRKNNQRASAAHEKHSQLCITSLIKPLAGNNRVSLLTNWVSLGLRPFAATNEKSESTAALEAQ